MRKRSSTIAGFATLLVGVAIACSDPPRGSSIDSNSHPTGSAGTRSSSGGSANSTGTAGKSSSAAGNAGKSSAAAGTTGSNNTGNIPVTGEACQGLPIAPSSDAQASAGGTDTSGGAAGDTGDTGDTASE